MAKWFLIGLQQYSEVSALKLDSFIALKLNIFLKMPHHLNARTGDYLVLYVLTILMQSLGKIGYNDEIRG